MSENFEITRDTTVREINEKYPQCAQVFESLGMGGCGGPLGPNEPLWLFAEAHRVPLETLISKLKDAIQHPENYIKDAPVEPEDTRYFVPFVKSAIIIGIFLGVAFGLYNLILIGIQKDYSGPSYSAIQAHGHAQFFGWVGLMIMGILAFILPRFKNVKFRYTQALYIILPVMVVSLVAQAFSRPFSQIAFNAEIVFATAVLELFALSAYAFLVFQVYREAKLKIEAYDLFLIAGVLWFLVAGILHLIISGIILRTHVGAVDAPVNSAYLTALAFGLSGNMIFGVAIRALPHLMGLKPNLNAKWFIFGFILYNLGITLRTLNVEPAILASSFILLGGLLVIFALRIFEGISKPLPIPATHNSYRTLVFYSFAFFLIAGLMLVGGDIYRLLTGEVPPHEYIGAFRHAITVGFITAMILGVGYRILPVFSGSEIPNFTLQIISIWLLMIGNVWRVGFELLTLTGSNIVFRLMPISGVLELIAIIIFSVLIWKVVSISEVKVKAFTGEITPSTRVVDLLDAYPWARETLISAGLIQLAVVHRPPAFVTLKTAAMMHRVNLENLISELKRAQLEKSRSSASLIDDRLAEARS